MSMALKNIEGDIRNVVRIDPNENLTSNEEPRYFGMTEISTDAAPSECLTGAGASVIRYTTLDRTKRSERVQRAWSETDDADKSGAAHELRVTADASDKSLFQASRAPKELIIVDADRRYIRRYKVLSHVMNLNSTIDPYDDVPKVDAAGNQTKFNYASVRVGSPRQVNAGAIFKIMAVFITGSEVYESNTYYVCLRRADRSLIKIHENTREVTVLLQNPNVDFDMDAFNVGYLSTRGGLRVEQMNFIVDMLTSPLNACINTVRFEIKLRPSDAFRTRNASQVVQDTQTEIVRDRTVFSQNLNINRPISCLLTIPEP